MSDNEVLHALVNDGYYRSPASVKFAEFERIVAGLGHVKRPMELRTGGANPVLEGEGGMTPHNDCNHYADCVVWYCRNADGAGDRTFIVEIADIVRELTEDELTMLARVGISLPLHEVARTQVVRRDDGPLRIFWSFSAVRLEPDPALVATVKGFRRLVNRIGETRRIQGGPIALDDGYFLIVNDHRFFHGRAALPGGSRRHLFRCYLRLFQPTLRTAALPV